METTITLECTLETHEHLREFEHELRQIHGLKVFFVEPRDAGAPVLISISVLHHGEQADLAIRRIAHTLYEFIHSSAREPGARRVTLVTIEGESVDLADLSSDQIRQIITEAHEGQGS